jgi:chromatin remodeling complex protein RSC6
MAPKTATKQTTTPAPAAAPAPEKKTASKKAPSKKEESKPVPAPAAPVQEKKPRRAPSAKKEKPVKTEDTSDNEAPQEPRQSHAQVKPTKETVNSEWEGIITMINEEMGRLRDAKPKAKGTKFLKTLNKLIRIALNHTNRVTKFKKAVTRKVNSSSGFLKPVNISPQLAAFTGWDVNKTYSRTAVTKFICEYVKNNKLFDQSEGGDKRNIVVDDKLKKLLNYDPKNPPKNAEGEALPLTYFRLQQYLKGHFSKPAEATVTVDDEELDEE